MTEEIQLDIMPPVPEISPWIPANHLLWKNSGLMIKHCALGNQFCAGFLIKAEGIKASQLPHLEDLQNLDLMFKVYAHKPEEQEKVLQGVIQNMRRSSTLLYLDRPALGIAWKFPLVVCIVLKRKRGSLLYPGGQYTFYPLRTSSFYSR